MTGNIYIHVGYSKAASTTLQNQIFSIHPEIIYYGYRTSSASISHLSEDFDQAEIKDFYDRIIYYSTVDYEREENEDYMQNIALEIRNIAERKDAPIVLSNERLTNSRTSDNGVKAKRLFSLFPEAKIIFVIRNQSDIIRSHYDMVPYHPSLSLPRAGNEIRISFRKYIELLLARPHNTIIQSLNYKRAIDYYSQLFGKTNIKVFLFENFKQYPDIFIAELFSYLNISKACNSKISKFRKDNSAGSHLHMPSAIKRMASILPGEQIPKSVKRPLKTFIKALNVKKKPTKVPPDLRIIVDDYFRASNAELNDLLGLGLERYEYPL